MDNSGVVNCAHAEILDIKKIKPHDKNPNRHPKNQIARLAEVIKYQGWRHPIIISKLSGKVCAGHGRLAVAKLLKLKQVPVDYQDFADSDAEYAFLVSDNAVALWAELDLSAINTDLADLDGESFNLEWLGIENFTLDPEPKEVEEDTITASLKFITCPNCKEEFEYKQGKKRNG